MFQILPHSEIPSIKDDAGQPEVDRSQSPGSAQQVLTTTSLGSDHVDNRQTLLTVAQPGGKEPKCVHLNLVEIFNHQRFFLY